MFETLLIANRGEIACRVIRTARRLGMRTVAVYSEADAGALHVRQADVAVPIGPAPARDSYLDIEKIVQAAKRSGAQAVHPGYGFLSENAEFAEACGQAGLVFVGPPADAIRAMGLKDEAKRRMEAAGVPVVPGYHDDTSDPEALRRAAREIGFPIVVKAVAGGGGKGMRLVEAEDDLEKAVAAAEREAQSAFGHPGVLIEKWITRPRHVEVQVFADDHGNAVHLFERDCSLQRRHQKVVEEAPAPGLPPALRERFGEAAVRAALAIDYRGAGTLEFILDASGPLDDAPFYFMEMNTRLQVEHPVTEAITGTDLVEWQLRVAAGEPLPRAQAELAIEGHALEARVYAEDPARGYLPQTGTLVRHRPPAEDGTTRVDTGVAEGDTITHFYDPMISKLIVHGPTREAAIAGFRRAVGDYEIAGVQTNLTLLYAVASLPAFANGDVHTGFLEEHKDQVAAKIDAAPREAVALLAAATLLDREARAHPEPTADPWSPWAATDAFLLNADGVDRFHWRFGKQDVEVTAHRSDDCVTLEWNGLGSVVRPLERAGDAISAVVDGARLHAKVIREAGRVYVVRGPATVRFDIVDDDALQDEAGASSGVIRAPLPGRVTEVLVAVGDRVKAGQPLVRLEAMKMEHTLSAGAAGKVEALNTSVGAQVEEGATLLLVG